MGKRGRPRHPDILTPREWEVLALLRDGLSNPEIAERLGVSRDTVKTHVSEILGKLGLASREEAAVWRPEERRPWWAALPLGGGIAARAAGAAVAVAVLAGVGVLVWALVRSDGATAPDRSAGTVMGASFIDLQQGWAVETLADTDDDVWSAGSRIVTTDDGGATWRDQFVTPLPLTSIDFVDAHHGWASSQGAAPEATATLFTTSDGGETWEELDETPRLDSVDFVSSDLGWAMSFGLLIATADGGRTWERVGSPCTQEMTAYVSFSSPADGWVLCNMQGGAGHQGKLLNHTEDGGATWQLVARADGVADRTPDPPGFGTPGYVHDIFFLNGTTGWLTYGGPATLLMQSGDGGQTWQRRSTPDGTTIGWLNGLHFVDAEHGYMVAAPNAPQGPGLIYTTSDGGESWTPLLGPARVPATSNQQPAPVPLAPLF